MAMSVYRAVEAGAGCARAVDRSAEVHSPPCGFLCWGGVARGFPWAVLLRDASGLRLSVAPFAHAGEPFERISLRVGALLIFTIGNYESNRCDAGERPAGGRHHGDLEEYQTGGVPSRWAFFSSLARRLPLRGRQIRPMTFLGGRSPFRKMAATPSPGRPQPITSLSRKM